MPDNLLPFRPHGQYPDIRVHDAIHGIVMRNVPTRVRILVDDIRTNRNLWSPATRRQRIMSLQSICAHTLSVEFEKVTGKTVEGHTRICLICRFMEDGVGQSQAGFRYQKIRRRPLIVSRVAGNFIIDVFEESLETLVRAIFDYRRNNRERGLKAALTRKQQGTA